MEALLKLLETLTHYAPLATLAAIYVIYKVLMAVRVNDLAHIDEKLDDLGARISRIEDRLDSFVERHV